MEEIRKPMYWEEHRLMVSNIWNIRWIERIVKFWWSYRKTKSKIVKQYTNTKTWYKQIWWIKVHNKVALTFIPRIKWKNCINHKNWIKTDNRVENLERCTNSENMKHAYRVLNIENPMKWLFLDNNPNAIKIIQYSLDDEIIKIRWSIKRASMEMKINWSFISKCTKWIRISAWWYKRKFYNKNWQHEQY